LTEQEYKILCSTCDSILLENDEDYERIAIPWLHVIREHPVFLEQYEDLFYPSGFTKRLKDYTRYIFMKSASYFRLIWNIIRSPKNLWVGDSRINQSYDVIFISHLLSPSQLSTDDDFYFGNVPYLLAQEGFTVLIALINHTSVPDSVLSNHIKSLHVPRLIIPYALPLISEFEIWKKCRNQARLLRNEALVEHDRFRKSVINRAAREATSYSTKTSIRISKVIGDLVSLTCPRAVVSTFEGHSWERIAFSSARKASLNKNFKCIGYQHAALFRLQHASRRLLGKQYDPDVILTPGQVGFNQLKRSAGLNEVALYILGSNRHSVECQRKKTDVCIVLPEGILSECNTLFSFSLQCARIYPHLKFIWRLHPRISFDEISRVGIDIRNLPGNIMISRKTLEEDLVNCKWALYRGSTAVVTAASNGVIPIYLSKTNELPVDPLYEIAANHPNVSSPYQFLLALDAPNWDRQSVLYCTQFYTPLDACCLAEQLKHVH
jgi:hypothetical protein